MLFCFEDDGNNRAEGSRNSSPDGYHHLQQQHHSHDPMTGGPYKVQRHAANIRERKRMLRSVPRSEIFRPVYVIHFKLSLAC